MRCFTSTREIRALAVGADGVIWAGSPGGLLRFSPESGRWELFTLADGLPDNSVLTVLVTSRGTVWAGTLGGAARLEGATFRGWGAEEGLPSPAVTALAEGADGTIWAGTLLGIARFDTNRWEAVTDTHEYARKSVRDIVRGADGSLWFAKENALVRRRGERSWEFFQHNYLDPDRRMGLATNSLLSLAVDEQGGLLIGTKLGVQRYDGKSWSHEHYDNRLSGGTGLEDNWIEDIAALPGGALWIAHGESRSFGGGAGVAFRLPGGRWRYLTAADGLPSNLVHAVAAGVGGEVWFGTAEGLAQWDGRQVSSWRPPETLPGNQVIALVSAGGGATHALLPQGIATLGGREALIEEKAPATGYSAAAFSDGLLYLAPAGGGLLVRKPDGSLHSEEAFARQTVHSLGGGPTGPILAVTGEGVRSGPAGGWSLLRSDGVPPLVRPLQALRGQDGSLWVAGEIPSPAGGRLVTYREDRGRFALVQAPGLLERLPRLARLSRDDSGAVLLSGPGGLYRYAGGWQAVPLPPGSRSLGAFTSLHGELWVAGRDGGLWRGMAGRWREIRIGGRAAPAGITAISADGARLWLGTAGQGLLRLDLGGVRPPL